MRIDPRSEIDGIRALRIRDRIRRARGSWITAEYLARCLKVSDSSAARLIDSLVSLGFLRESQLSGDGYQYYDVTEHSRFISTDDEVLQRTPVRELYRLPEH